MGCFRNILRIPPPPQSTAGILDDVGKQSSLEPLVYIIQNYAISFMVLMMAPFILTITQSFNDSLKIAKYYEIDERNEWMYLLFGCMVIPFHLFLDVVVLNVQELFHGHKVYEYIAYSVFRFRTRKVRWSLHEPHMDSGVNRQFRTLDLVSFSSQYYFSSLMHAMGIFFFCIGLVIIIAQKFNFLGDTTLPFIITLFWVICIFIKEVSITIGNALGIWTIPLVRKRNLATVEPNDVTVPTWDAKYKSVVNDIIDQKYVNDEIVQLDHFRHSFVKHNRPWIVQQLRGLLKHDVLLRHNTVFEKIYLMLGNMLAMEDPDSSDSDSSEPELELYGITKDIAMMWIIQSRRRIHLKHIAKPAIRSMLQPKCGMCGMTNNTLRVCFAEPLDKIIDIYEMANVQKVLVDDQWRSYLRNTTVTNYTLCLPCSRHLDEIRAFSLNKIAVIMAREWLNMYRTKLNDARRLKIQQGKLNVDITDSESDAKTVEGQVVNADEPRLVHHQTKQILSAWLKMCTIAHVAESEKEAISESDSSDHSMM
jgi:hypothetical protein